MTKKLLALLALIAAVPIAVEAKDAALPPQLVNTETSSRSAADEVQAASSAEPKAVAFRTSDRSALPALGLSFVGCMVVLLGAFFQNHPRSVAHRRRGFVLAACGFTIQIAAVILFVVRALL